MFLITVKGVATTASFRIPESHTFHQTLPLPPITTLTGMMGAALGLSFEKALQFREENGVQLGVTGQHKGQILDLWKYHKIKSDPKINKLVVISDVLLREYLSDFKMKLVIGAEDENVLTRVRDGFLNPFYALTAGNSDDLLKVCCVGEIKEVEKQLSSEFAYTVLPGDYTGVYEPLLDLRKTPITETIRAPQVFLLPTTFNFIGKERRIARREHFTFVGSPIQLQGPIPAFLVEKEAVALM